MNIGGGGGSKETASSDSSQTQQLGMGEGYSGEQGISSGATTYNLPDATALQQLGETSLAQLLSNYMSAQGKGGQTFDATPAQKSVLEQQTQNYMQGLQQLVDEYTKSGVSQAQQSALARGIPLSDIARGMESNVYAQGINTLGQGYNQAKTMELQNLLNYPMQTASLSQQLNAPYLDMMYNLGMSRLIGPRDTAISGSQSTANYYNTLKQLLGQEESTGINKTEEEETHGGVGLDFSDL